MIEVSDCRFCEWLAKSRHAALPLLVPDHREALNVCVVFDIELDVLPQRARFPAVEACHIE